MNNKKSNADDVANESNDSATESDEKQANGGTSQYTTEIIFSAPFRTDIVIDPKKLLEEYKEFNSEVARKLNSTSQFAGWKLDPHIDYSETSSYGLISPDKPGLTNIAPYFIGYVIRAEDKCSGDTLKYLQTKINDELNSRINKIISNSGKKENQYNFDNNFIVSKTKLKFYEFGFGSITVYVEYKKAEMLDASALKYAIESDKIKSYFEDFISGYINEYEKSVQSVPGKFLQKSQIGTHNNLVEPRKVYWTHRLISFTLTSGFINSEEKNYDDVASSEDKSSNKDEVSKFFDKKKSLLTQLITVEDESKITRNELKNKGQMFIPGVGNSILLSWRDLKLVSDIPKEQKELKLGEYLETRIGNISNIVTVVGTYSAFMHYFHENLLHFVNEMIKDSDKERGKLFDIGNKGMTKVMNKILVKLHIYSNINFLFQEYESSYLSSIGKGAYEKLEQVWKFDKNWDSIKQQIKTLEKIYDKSDNYIDRKQRRVLNIIAVIFTITAGFSSLGKVRLFTIDSIAFDNIFAILCLVALVYFAYKVGAFLFRKYLPKLCDGIISFCKKNSTKNDS